MISIRKTTDELERLEELGRAAIACYTDAIGSTDRYAIEFNAEQVARFRTQLQALKQQLSVAGSPGQIKNVQSTFDAELKGFQQRVRDYLAQLREEIRKATAAVETFAGSYSQSGSELEASVKRQLGHLNEVATSNDIVEIRGGIRTVTAKITADVEQMRSSNQLAIAQFKDEIRLLHQEIHTMQRSLRPPSDEQTTARGHLFSHIDELTRRHRPFSVLVAVVRNLDGLRNCHARNILELGLDTFKARFESRLPGLATAVRWNEGQFAAVLDIEPSAAIAMSRELMRTLSAPIVEQVDGAFHTLAFDAITGSIHFRAGVDPAQLQTKITQLVSALTGQAQ